jgi:hypothetical protein
MLPICSPNIKPGKPTDQAQTVGQMLNDIAFVAALVLTNSIVRSFVLMRC